MKEKLQTVVISLKTNFDKLVIADNATYQEVGSVVKTADGYIKQVEEVFGTPKKKSYEAYKASSSLYDQAIKPLKAIKSQGKAKMAAWIIKTEAEANKALSEAPEGEDVPAVTNIPHVDGVVLSKRWHAEIVSVQELFKAYSDGSTPLPELNEKELAQLATILKLNKLAIALKSSLNIPGVKAVSKVV